MNDIIRHIWQWQGGAYGFLAKRPPWVDYPMETATDNSWAFIPDPDTDWYFTPCTFYEPHRANDYTAPVGVLFADLDPVDPRWLSIRPSLAWETSPGSYQALWLLTDLIPYARFANLNRRLTMATGADPGGWQGSKVLRVPGTLNHKYDPPERGRLLWWEPETAYSVSFFEEELPTLPNRPGVGAKNAPVPMSEADYKSYVDRHWPSLTLRIRALLYARYVQDRSFHIVKCIHQMTDHNMPAEVIFHLLWWAPFNKWRTDRYRPEQLWAEIQRAHIRITD